MTTTRLAEGRWQQLVVVKGGLLLNRISKAGSHPLPTSVTTGTLSKYKSGWEAWVVYVTKRTPRGHAVDHYFKDLRLEGKATYMIRFFRKRWAEGKREKAAWGVGAAVNKRFDIARQDSAWITSATVALARRACRRTVEIFQPGIFRFQPGL